MPFSFSSRYPTPISTSRLIVVSRSQSPWRVAIAILSYRLYDIDVVISRTLVYGSLAVFITAVYVGIAVGIGALVGSGGKPNLGLSILATAIVAVGFQPVRERLQRVANRLVYGRRATPYEVLASSPTGRRGIRGRRGDAPHGAGAAEGTGAEAADVWLRSGDVSRRCGVAGMTPKRAEPLSP